MFNLSDTKVKKKFRGIFIISITILIVLVFYFYYFRNNFIRSLFSYSRDYYNYFVYHPHSGKESVNLEYKLDKIIEKRDNSYSITGFIYITDWKYKYFQPKYILNKGKDCPTIFLDKIVNNLVFKINIGEETKEFNILNVNINKWFHFALVVQNLQVDLYYNGKLFSSHVINYPAKLEDNHLIICKDAGFAGLIYDFYLYERALSYKEVNKLSMRNPPINEKYFKDRY